MTFSSPLSLLKLPISQIWLVLYKVPFPHEYVLEVGQRRVVLRYKG